MSASEDVEMKPSSDLSTLSEPFQGEQTMLILVGLIASGKSTFAQALERHLPSFRRCNQDDLGSRQLVEELAYRMLSEGRSPCIDRTNFNATQRSYWTAIAHEFPGTSISIIVFDTPYHVCASRLERRTSHPTIRDAQHGMEVLQKFASEFSMPSPDEGYDQIIHLRPADHPRPEYSRDDILTILARLKASARHAGTGNVRQSSGLPHFGRGGTYYRNSRPRGYRGGGGGYRGFMTTRSTVNSSTWFTSRDRDTNVWRRPSSDVAAHQEISDQRSAVAASVPAKEGSKGKDSAEEHYNSS